MQSQSLIQSWKSEGHAEGRAEGLVAGMLEARRADLIRVLLLKFRGKVPGDLIASVQHLSDLETLTDWFDAAVVCPDLELFRLTLRHSRPRA